MKYASIPERTSIDSIESDSVFEHDAIAISVYPQRLTRSIQAHASVLCKPCESFPGLRKLSTRRLLSGKRRMRGLIIDAMHRTPFLTTS